MRTLFVFGGFFFLAISPTTAQNPDSVAIKKFYEENTIYWMGTLKYMKNNQLFPIKNLKNEIRFSPDAIYEYKMSMHNKRMLTGAIIVSSALLVSGALVKNRQVRLGLLAGSLITIGAAFPFSLKFSSHMGRAIWLHNRDLLLR